MGEKENPLLSLYGENELISLEDLTSVLERQIKVYSNSYKDDLDDIEKCLKEFIAIEKKEDGTIAIDLKERSSAKALEIYEECKRLASHLIGLIAKDKKTKKFYLDKFGTIVYTLTAITDKKLGDINLRKTVFDVKLEGKIDYVGLQGDDLRIRLSSVNKEVKKLKLEEKANKIWEYMTIHYNNYQKCLEDTTDGELNGGYVNEGQWEHMMVHEKKAFVRIRRNLSVDSTIRGQITNSDQKYLKNIYGKEVYPTDWNSVQGGERAEEAWKHYVRSKGRLNGLTLGDLGNMQFKANKSELNLSSLTNMYHLLEMLKDFLEGGLSSAKDLAEKYAIESFFSEKASQITQDFVDKIKDEVTRALLQEILDNENKKINMRTS